MRREAGLPDGILENSYNGRRAPGAEPVPLIGTTDQNGVATFRFPADRARQGFYLPRRIVAFRMRDGQPHCVIWRIDGGAPIEDQVARTGRALPTLRFGAGPGQPAMLVARGIENHEDLELFGRVGNARVRRLPINTEEVIHVSGLTIYTFHDGAPAHLDREVVTAATGAYDMRYACRTYSSDEFARCLQGAAVVELGSPRKTREVTFRIPSGVEADEVWLESVDQPFLVGNSFDSDGTSTVDLPDLPASGAC